MSKFDHINPQEIPLEVDILPLGRRRVTRRFTLGKNNAVDDPIFGVNGDADVGVLGLTTAGYADLRLILQKVLPAKSHLEPSTLVQVFETITDELAREVADVVDYELNGLKRTTSQFIGSNTVDTSGFVVGTQEFGTSPVQYLANVKIDVQDAFTRVNAVYLQAGVVSQSLGPEKDGLRELTTQSFYAKYESALGPTLSETEDNLLGFPTWRTSSIQLASGAAIPNAEFVQSGPDKEDYDLNGLRRIVRTLVARAGQTLSGYTVGTSALSGTYLGKLSIRPSVTALVVAELTYLEAGVVDAEKKSDSDAGLLYVTFRSWHTKVVPTCLKAGSALNDDITVAFQGGVAAQTYRDRIENVNGFRTYTVTVMMKIDGSALVAGADQLVNSYNKYIKYTRPGALAIDASSANALAWGFIGYPGAEKEPLALVEEYISTVSTLDGSFAPFTVTQWASGFLSVVQDGEPGVVSKSAHGYLGGASGVGLGGNPSYSYSISSTPTTAQFLAMVNTVVASSNGPAFVTDEGVRWYKKTRISIPGVLDTALS